MNAMDTAPTAKTTTGRFDRSIASSCSGPTAELPDSSIVMTSRIFL